MGYIVNDPDGEVTARGLLVKLVEDRLQHRWGKLLRGEAIAAGDDSRLACQRGNAFRPCLTERGHYIEVEWVPGSSWLLSPVQHSKAASAARQGRQERGKREGTIKADL